MLVHCSAGVGRSGAFVALDSMLQKMELEQVIDVYNFVTHMRSKRSHLVQTVVSIHLCVRVGVDSLSFDGKCNVP